MSIAGYQAHQPTVPLFDRPVQWYAIHVRARHEKKVAEELTAKSIKTFLPLHWQVSHWSDRQKRVQLPLFPCYAFVNVPLTPESHLAVVRAYGILGFVGRGSEPTPIPESEIDAIKQLLDGGLAVTPHTYCRIGQRVRVRGGALDGIEGILTGVVGNRRLVISVETVQRSVSVSVEGYQVEPA